MRNQNEARNDLSPMPLDVLSNKLLASPRPCDQRQGRDIRRLLDLSGTLWAGRVEPLCASPVEGRKYAVLMHLNTPGLVWQEQPVIHDRWTLVLVLTSNYPMAIAQARFAQVIPYCPHVCQRRFAPTEAECPPELREFITALRQGAEGYCCYARQEQWSPDAAHDLALVVWQISRLLCGAAFHGELGTLNRHALACYIDLARQNKLPIGTAETPPLAALPLPIDTGAAPAVMLDAAGDDVEWLSNEPEN